MADSQCSRSSRQEIRLNSKKVLSNKQIPPRKSIWKTGEREGKTEREREREKKKRQDGAVRERQDGAVRERGRG